jgi:hypothetical protein
VYQALHTYTNRKTGQCNPPQEKVAEKLGMHIRMFKRYLRQLREAGWVGVKRGHWRCSYKCRERAARDTSVPNARDTSVPNARDSSVLYEQLHLFNEQDVFEPEVKTAAAVQAPILTQPERPTAPAAAAGPAGANKNPGEAARRSAPRSSQDSAAEIPPAGRTPERDVAEQLVADLIPQHPEPGAPDRAVAEAEKALASAADPEEVCAAARRNHEAWRAHWATLDPHRFIPQLWRWFASGEWKYPPVERKGVQRETWSAQLKRESDESDQSYYRMLAEHQMWDVLREYGQDPGVWRAKIQAA